MEKANESQPDSRHGGDGGGGVGHGSLVMVKYSATSVRHFVSSDGSGKHGTVRVISKAGNTLFKVSRRSDGAVFVRWADGLLQELGPRQRSGVRCGCNDVLIDVGYNGEVCIILPRRSGFSVFTTLSVW